MDIKASTHAQAQMKLATKENDVPAPKSKGREPSPLALSLAQTEKALRDLIEAFAIWEQSPQGASPINRATERSPAGLRKYAVEQIRKANAIKLGPKDNDWWKFIVAASNALASAWWIEFNADKPKREAAERASAERERTTREHEQALKPNTKRISDLHSIIRDAAAGEKLLADIYRALQAHDAAEDARKELLHIKDKSEAAAIALGKKGPVIDLSEPVDGASAMANILHMATAAR